MDIIVPITVCRADGDDAMRLAYRSETNDQRLSVQRAFLRKTLSLGTGCILDIDAGPLARLIHELKKPFDYCFLRELYAGDLQGER